MQALVIELRYYYGGSMVRLLGLLQSTLGLAPLVFNIVPYVFSVFWEGEMRERERLFSSFSSYRGGAAMWDSLEPIQNATWLFASSDKCSSIRK